MLQKRGELILIAAGSKKIYNRAKSLLNDISKQVFYVGSNHSHRKYAQTCSQY